jgi:hypothetical protein
VELLEDWPGDPAHGLAVGAASQRTLIVRVDGNTASVIPPLPTSVPASMKAYPETPRLNEVPTAGGIVGTRTETTSLVATAPAGDAAGGFADVVGHGQSAGERTLCLHAW